MSYCEQFSDTNDTFCAIGVLIKIKIVTFIIVIVKGITKYCDKFLSSYLPPLSEIIS